MSLEEELRQHTKNKQLIAQLEYIATHAPDMFERRKKCVKHLTAVVQHLEKLQSLGWPGTDQLAWFRQELAHSEAVAGVYTFRDFLCASVAVLMKEAGEDPTATHEGPLEGLCCVVFETCNQSCGDMHRRIRKILKRIREG
jgi:hypothetical protein